jgi:hypothetical protein
VDDVGVDLLRDERQTGLLPGQARGAVRDRGRTRDDLGVRVEAAQPLGVRALADDREVRTRRAESSDEAVDVAPDASPVRGDSGRVQQDART